MLPNNHYFARGRSFRPGGHQSRWQTYFAGSERLLCDDDLRQPGSKSRWKANLGEMARSRRQGKQSPLRCADTDKDGGLSLEEARAYGRKRDLFSAEFRDADTNHDGYVTREEAQVYYASKEGSPR